MGFPELGPLPFPPQSSAVRTAGRWASSLRGKLQPGHRSGAGCAPALEVSAGPDFLYSTTAAERAAYVVEGAADWSRKYWAEVQVEPSVPDLGRNVGLTIGNTITIR